MNDDISKAFKAIRDNIAAIENNWATHGKIPPTTAYQLPQPIDSDKARFVVDIADRLKIHGCERVVFRIDAARNYRSVYTGYFNNGRSYDSEWDEFDIPTVELVSNALLIGRNKEPAKFRMITSGSQTTPAIAALLRGKEGWHHFRTKGGHNFVAPDSAPVNKMDTFAYGLDATLGEPNPNALYVLPL